MATYKRLQEIYTNPGYIENLISPKSYEALEELFIVHDYGYNKQLLCFLEYVCLPYLEEAVKRTNFVADLYTAINRPTDKNEIEYFLRNISRNALDTANCTELFEDGIVVLALFTLTGVVDGGIHSNADNYKKTVDILSAGFSSYFLSYAEPRILLLEMLRHKHVLALSLVDYLRYCASSSVDVTMEGKKLLKKKIEEILKAALHKISLVVSDTSYKISTATTNQKRQLYGFSR